MRAAGTRRAIRSGQAFGAVALVALALRGWHAGDPLLGVDQQFYDAVGHRMLAGALPYRDIFDIKPMGIFALHGLTAAFAPFSRMAIDIVATAFAAATGCVIFAIVRKLVGARADAATSAACGLFAALLYIAYLPVFDGYGAQTPIVYNVFTALAA